MNKIIIGLMLMLASRLSYASGNILPDPAMWVLIFLSTPWMWGVAVVIIGVIIYALKK